MVLRIGLKEVTPSDMMTFTVNPRPGRLFDVRRLQIDPLVAINFRVVDIMVGGKTLVSFAGGREISASVFTTGKAEFGANTTGPGEPVVITIRNVTNRTELFKATLVCDVIQ